MVRIIKDGTVRRLRVRGRDAVEVRGGPGASAQAAFWAVRIGARIASAGEFDCASSSTREVVAHAWRRLCCSMRVLGFEVPAPAVLFGAGCRR
jgi:hypothetical protein